MGGVEVVKFVLQQKHKLRIAVRDVKVAQEKFDKIFLDTDYTTFAKIWNGSFDPTVLQTLDFLKNSKFQTWEQVQTWYKENVDFVSWDLDNVEVWDKDKLLTDISTVVWIPPLAP